MLRRGDAEFKKLVDDTVKGLMKSGEVEQALCDAGSCRRSRRNSVNLAFPMSDTLKFN
jgi:hypothetical protein